MQIGFFRGPPLQCAIPAIYIPGLRTYLAFQGAWGRLLRAAVTRRQRAIAKYHRGNRDAKYHCKAEEWRENLSLGRECLWYISDTRSIRLVHRGRESICRLTGTSPLEQPKRGRSFVDMALNTAEILADLWRRLSPSRWTKTRENEARGRQKQEGMRTGAKRNSAGRHSAARDVGTILGSRGFVRQIRRNPRSFHFLPDRKFSSVSPLSSGQKSPRPFRGGLARLHWTHVRLRETFTDWCLVVVRRRFYRKKITIPDLEIIKDTIFSTSEKIPDVFNRTD